MAQAVIPLIGALGGAGVAYGLGFTSLTALTMGASIGWMVGSWAMMGSMDMKNDPIDTGAHEAPRFNTAVRGAIVPILFGTNRVPAQIIWQANFETIRHETQSGGGGKMGGSGGGKVQPSVSNVSYTYKIDAVYHLGMPDVPMTLQGGWLGGKRISNDSITQLGLSSTGGIAYTTPPRESASPEQEVGVSYDEGVFFRGNIDEEDTWAHLSGNVGSDIVWPGTCWVGFSGLDLGSTGSMPQLNFEVGPTTGSISYNSRPISMTAASLHDYSLSGGEVVGVDSNLNTYVLGGPTRNLVIFNKHSNLVTYKTEAELAAMAGVSSSTLDVFVKPIGNYVYVIAQGSPGASAFKMGCYIYSMPDPVTGEMALLGHSYGYTNVNDYTVQNISLVGSTLVVMAYDGTLVKPHLFFFAGTPESAPNQRVNLVTLRYDHAQMAKGFFNSSTSQKSTQDVATNAFAVSQTTQGANGGQYLYIYYNKAFMAKAADEAAGVPGSYVTPGFCAANYATYPNGAIVKLNISQWCMNPLPGDASSMTIVARDDIPQVDNQKWVDVGGVVGGEEETTQMIPFTDENTRLLDGGTPTGTNYPAYAFGYQTMLTEFVPLVAFVMLDSDPAYNSIFDEIVLASSVKPFYFDPVGERWVYVGRASGEILQQNDLGYGDWSGGGGGSSLDNTSSAVVHWDLESRQLYVSTAGNSLDSHVALSKIGQLDFDGIDVPPPYIIKQILTHPVFGVQPGADVIDSTSYDAAVAYCIENDLLVSTQYRRSQPALQAIENLLAIYGGWLSVNMATGKIKFGLMELDSDPVRTIDNNHLVVRSDGDLPVKTTKGAVQDTFNIIRINFLDRSMDYQNNQAEARDEVDEDINGPRPKEFPPDFVMSPATAEWMADRALWTNLYIRDTHQFYLGWKDSDLEPGDHITLVDSFSGLRDICQIVRWHEVERGVYEVIASQQRPYVATGTGVTSVELASLLAPTSSSSVGYLTSSGTVVHSGIVTDPSCRYVGGPGGFAIPEPVQFQAYELPAEYDTTPQVYVNWVADNFAKGAALYVSPDNVSFANMSYVEPFPLSGTVLTELTGNEASEFQEGFEFLLLPTPDWSATSPSYTMEMSMNDVSAAGMHVGAGLMYVGSEMLAYQDLTLIAQNRYRARRVYRGWGGTKVSAHSSGDIWVKHGTGVFAQEYTQDQVGTTFYYKVVPYNMAGYSYPVSSVAAQSYTIKGSYQRPQSPPAIHFGNNRGNLQVNVGSDIDIQVDWQDSARASGYGAGGYGTTQGYGGFTTDPLSHSWRVNVVGSGNVVVRSTVVTTPSFTYTRSMNMVDNGAWRGNVAFQVTAFSHNGDSPRTSVASLQLFY